MTLLLLACANAPMDDTGTADAGGVYALARRVEVHRTDDALSMDLAPNEVPVDVLCCDDDSCTGGAYSIDPDGLVGLSCGALDRAVVTLLVLGP